MKNVKYGYSPIIAIFPAVVIFFVFYVLISIANIALSFTDFKGTFMQEVNFVGFHNYRLALFSPVISRGVLNAIRITFIFSISVTLIQNFFATILAVLCNFKIRLRNFYRTVIFMPTILGTVVIGMSWRLILNPYSGPVNYVYNLFGYDSAILGDKNVALYYVIFVMIWANFGYAMVLYLSGLQSIPKELYESSEVEGAGNIAQFYYITLPLLRPIVTINILISIIGTLRSFDLIMVMTSGGPADATTTLGLFIFKNLNSSISQGFVSALSLIHFLIVGVVVFIAYYYLKKKETEL